MNAPEEWRTIPGHPMYDVSSEGRVRSCGKHVMVHQLVAMTFLGPRPDESPLIRHLDGDRFNNHATNLAYGNASDNAFDAVRAGTHWLARRDVCLRGHPFDEDNTYRTKAGHRLCRICRRASSAKFHSRAFAEELPCPACGRSSLTLAIGGYPTCTDPDCPEPDAVSTLIRGQVAPRRGPSSWDAPLVVTEATS